jgi:preprotein translocase subunit SecE
MGQNSTSLIAELGRVALYKRSQGRVARGITAAVIAVISCYGAWALYNAFLNRARLSPELKYGIPALIAFSGVWIAFRFVHHDRFAEFLIATESEVDKVHWPDRKHVHRATVVVVVTMLLMGAMLFVFDLVWQIVFEAIGFLEYTG